MSGASSGADPDVRARRQWDVALSFAGAQRDYVEQVAQALQARDVRCFYDADEEIDLWGKFLPEELPAIYGEQAAAVVVFVSADYAAQDWTRLERRAALNRAVQERREYVLPARFDDTPLPGLLRGLVTVNLRGRTPQQFATMIVGKLAALGITGLASAVDAGDPARDVEVARPAGAVRVAEADLRRLGVHAAISVDGVPDEVPPQYVPRDVDTAEHGVQAKVAAAADRGGFVLLVGGSSVGKTRTAVEAVQTLLPHWWLMHPAGPAEASALAMAPSPRTVVWLDELQRYLDGEHGLTGAVVRALLGAPHPIVIISTLWPDWYTAYTTLPVSRDADPHAREREVLDLAEVVRIGPEFSPAEQDRARAAAARDPRLKKALESAGYGLTQTLAAAPQLVACWEDARTADPYAWAVLTAALDAARLGGRAPLSAEFLRAAAPGYITSVQRAEAPSDWFEQALTGTQRKLHGAAAALSPSAADMRQVAGYIPADYLIQHASRERNYERVPASTWDAFISYIRDPADTARFADSARNRLLYRYAIPLYRHAADAGEEGAAMGLAGLLAKRGDLDGLRARADAGDRAAAYQLAQLDDLNGLRARADAGDEFAAGRLADLLAMYGELDELRTRADAGDTAAVGRLDRLLEKRGDVDGLRARADAGDEFAAGRLADLLEKRGDLDGAVQVLRALADAGDEDAARRLTGWLALRGDLDGLAQILRGRADAGDEDAARWLAELLAERGDLDGAEQILRARAEAGDREAADQLDRLRAEDAASRLAGRGDLDGLRARADAGDEDAARRLAGLLEKRGDLDGAEQILRARADVGDWEAALRLVGLLEKRGDVDGLRARADAGDEFAAGRLAGLLEGRGDLDEAEQILRALADAGDDSAAWRLAGLLEKRGDLDGAEQILRALADTGDMHAAEKLIRLLDQRGDVEGLRTRADTGDRAAAWRLAERLAERGDLDGLRARADAGDEGAADQLIHLLAEQGDLQGLRARADAGGFADERLADLLAWRLADMLAEQGQGEEAERLRRFGLNPDGSISST